MKQLLAICRSLYGDPDHHCFFVLITPYGMRYCSGHQIGFIFVDDDFIIANEGFCFTFYDNEQMIVRMRMLFCRAAAPQVDIRDGAINDFPHAAKQFLRFKVHMIRGDYKTIFIITFIIQGKLRTFRSYHV